MATQGSYTTAPCPDPMTRAALLALRTAGTLRPGCHYTITNGPTIGTTGNTSPTTIELHATSATELALEALVHTTFDNTAWDGLYDIDKGASGSIVFLADSWNNRVSDPDVNAATVHQRFPWHAGSDNLRDNVIRASILTGWGPAINAGGTIKGNDILSSQVDLTGRTGVTSSFERNRLSAANVVLNPATSFFVQNNIDAGTVAHLGTGAGSFSFQNNTMLTGLVNIDATTTAQVTLNSNVFGGTSGSYRVQVTGKTTNTVIFSGNRAFNPGVSTQDVLIQGTGTVTITGNNLNATNISIDGSGTTSIINSTIGGGTLTKAAAVTGPLTVDGCDLTTTVFSATGTGAGGFAFIRDYVRDATVTMNSSSSGLLSFNSVDVVGTTLTISASGSAAPLSQFGTLLGTTLDTGGFSITSFDIVGGTKTLTADQSDRVRNGLGSNLV